MPPSGALPQAQTLHPQQCWGLGAAALALDYKASSECTSFTVLFCTS